MGKKKGKNQKGADGENLENPENVGIDERGGNKERKAGFKYRCDNKKFIRVGTEQGVVKLQRKERQISDGEIGKNDSSGGVKTWNRKERKMEGKPIRIRKCGK